MTCESQQIQILWKASGLRSSLYRQQLSEQHCLLYLHKFRFRLQEPVYGKEAFLPVFLLSLRKLRIFLYWFLKWCSCLSALQSWYGEVEDKVLLFLLSCAWCESAHWKQTAGSWLTLCNPTLICGAENMSLKAKHEFSAVPEGQDVTTSSTSETVVCFAWKVSSVKCQTG